MSNRQTSSVFPGRSSLMFLVRWFLRIVPMAAVTGSAVAFFLWILEAAIHYRFRHPWLLYLLPLAGLLIHFIYSSVGKSAEKGNNLIIEQVHNETGEVPKRMAPIILFATVITHLFGGSAGREGTAVQMGGSIASMFGAWYKLTGSDMRFLLVAGIAAGFGAVFGTPLAGAVFAIEVLTIGRLQYDVLIPALIAGLTGDLTVAAWHIEHTQYHIDAFRASSRPAFPYGFNLMLLGKTVLASAAFGLVSHAFAEMVGNAKSVCLALFSRRWIIPLVGGLTIILLTVIAGRPDYLSLGIDAQYNGAVTITSAFKQGGAETWSWLWKTVYTAVTLGTGFKGGEVTPLFYVGATLGNTLAGLLNAPVGLFAALGFIAVFAGATNTPLACTLMGAELFGGEHILLFAVACFTAYLFSGHKGIYSAQLTSVPKIPGRSTDNNLPRNTDQRRGYLHEKFKKYRLPFTDVR